MVECSEVTRSSTKKIAAIYLAKKEAGHGTPTQVGENGLVSTYRCGVGWCALIPSTNTPTSFECHWSKQPMRRICGAVLGCLPWVRYRYFFSVNRYRGWLRLHELAARPLRRGRCSSLRVCDLYSERTRPLHLEHTKP